jgi:serine/tyrosine/threonine adenylyltransferase
LRGGTFEFARVYGNKDDFEALFNYTLLRHFPESKKVANKAKYFLEQMIERQTSLVAEWMRVGFIHGVMNTDNMSICCHTFDYGPCAFLNAYHREQVFSSIDRGGRYSFQNQRQIIVWNLSVLIECFDSYISQKERQDMILTAHKMMENKFYTMMASKL